MRNSPFSYLTVLVLGFFLLLQGCPAPEGPTAPSNPTATHTICTCSPTPTRTLTLTGTPTPTPTSTHSRTSTGTFTVTSSPTQSSTPTLTRTITNTLTLSPTPTITLSPTQTSTRTISPTPTRSLTPFVCAFNDTVGNLISYTVGYWSVYDMIYTYQVDFPQDMNINSIRVSAVYYGNPIQAGIYSDNGSDYPGQLLYATSLQSGPGPSLSPTPTDQVYTFSGTVTFSLPAGKYWLAFYGGALGVLNTDFSAPNLSFRAGPGQGNITANPNFPVGASQGGFGGPTAAYAIQLGVCHNNNPPPTATRTSTVTPTSTSSATPTRTATSTATSTPTTCPITLGLSSTISSGTGTWVGGGSTLNYTNIADWSAATSTNSVGVNLADGEGGVVTFADDPGYGNPASVPVAIRVIYRKNNANMRLVWDLSFADSSTGSTFGGPGTEIICCSGIWETFELDFSGGNELTLSQINQTRMLLSALEPAGTTGGSRHIDIDSVQILYEPCQP